MSEEQQEPETPETEASAEEAQVEEAPKPKGPKPEKKAPEQKRSDRLLAKLEKLTKLAKEAPLSEEKEVDGKKIRVYPRSAAKKALRRLKRKLRRIKGQKK